MIIIYGHKYNFTQLGQVGFECPKCNRLPSELYEAEKKFTLYWIPTFTLNKEYAIGCESCQEKWLLKDGVGQQLHLDLLAGKPTLAAPEKIIMFVGPTNTGKSSTANALLGYSNFPVGAGHGTTTTIDQKDYLNGYKLWDTPGLLDEDQKYMPAILAAAKFSKLVIYTTTGQLYRQELEFLEKLYHNQRQWDGLSKTSHQRQLILYVNQQDIKEHTMSSSIRTREMDEIKKQVVAWIPSERVVAGASAPLIKGIKQPPQIDALKRIVLVHTDS